MATSSKTTGKTSEASATAGLPSLDDLGKLLQQFQLPGLDISAIVESQRKDFEALAEANRQAYEGMQALAPRGTEMLKEAFEQWQSSLAGGNRAGAQAGLAQQGIEQAIANFQELAQMEADSRGRAWKVLQDRFQENFGSMQNLLPKR